MMFVERVMMVIIMVQFLTAKILYIINKQIMWIYLEKLLNRHFHRFCISINNFITSKHSMDTDYRGCEDLRNCSQGETVENQEGEEGQMMKYIPNDNPCSKTVSMCTNMIHVQ